jgi:hypothetical protein
VHRNPSMCTPGVLCPLGLIILSHCRRRYNLCILCTVYTIYRRTMYLSCPAVSLDRLDRFRCVVGFHSHNMMAQLHEVAPWRREGGTASFQICTMTPLVPPTFWNRYIDIQLCLVYGSTEMANLHMSHAPRHAPRAFPWPVIK